MAEYSGVLSMLVLVSLFIAALFVLERRLTRTAPAAGAPPAAGSAEACARDGDPSGTEWPALEAFRLAHDLYPLALLHALGGVAAAFVLVAAPVLRELGWPGLRALVGFSLPICVGLLYEWRKGVFKW